MKRILLLITCLSWPVSSLLASEIGDPDRGMRLYPVCTACHGAQGAGNAAMKAPKIAGQMSWYVQRQMELFQQGARGTASGDMQGMQMAAMAKGPQLKDPQALADLVAYIGTFPDQAPTPTVSGNVETGKQLYAVCASCHGQKAEGIESMAGPRLAGQSDWYLLSSLQKFKQGQRGYHATDHGGRQMRGMVAALTTDQAMRDVVAYINTLD